MPKLLFFDIDGTLLDERTQTIPQSAKDALAKTREKGNLIFINTGRTPSCVDEKLRSLGFDGYLCGCGTWVEYGNEVLLREELTHEEAVDIVLKLRELKLASAYEGNRDVFYDDDAGFNDERINRHKGYFESIGRGAKVDFDDPEFTYTKFFIYQRPDSDMEGFMKFIDGRFDYIGRGDRVAEITLTGYSKATAIDFIRGKLGVALEDCYAFGDGPNDLPMLTHVPNSVAMGSGDREIFDKCAFVTKPLMEDGLAYAMEHYGLI